MEKRLNIRIEKALYEKIKKISEETKKTMSEIAKLALIKYFEKDLDASFEEIKFEIKGSYVDQKAKAILITLSLADHELLNLIASEFEITKSKAISKLLAMYVRREITYLSLSVDSLNALREATEQLRKVGINFNQCVHALNLINLQKKEGRHTDITARDIKDLIKSLNDLSVEIENTSIASQNVITLAKRIV